MLRARRVWTTIIVVLAACVITVIVERRRVKTIQGHIGEPLVELLKQNHEKWDVNTNYDNSPLIFPDNDLSGEVFTFIYNQPGAEFTLPTAKLIWFTQYAGVVTEVLIDTSEQKASLVETYKQLHELRKSLIQARWEEIQSIDSYNDVQATIAKSEGTTPSFSAGKYKKGDAEAVIMVSTPGKVITPDQSRQANFVARVWIHDEVLERAQSRKTYDLRIKLKGNDGIALPLSYWVK